MGTVLNSGNINQALDLEIAFQAQRAASISKVAPTPDFVVERYRHNRHHLIFPKEYLFRRMGDISGKEILDFGCGEGELSTQMARLGARVTGLDISPQLIEIAKRRAQIDGVAGETSFLASNILESPLPENRFDIVVCYAVLHHVPIPEVFPQLLRCLKPSGMIYMVEPLALSSLLVKLRNLVPVPKDASPVERPLNLEELNYLSNSLQDSRVQYFELFGRLQRFFPNRNKIDRGHPFTKAALVALGTLDYLLLTLLPPLRRFYGEVVVEGRKR